MAWASPAHRSVLEPESGYEGHRPYLRGPSPAAQERRQEIAGPERLVQTLLQQRAKLNVEQKAAEAAGSAQHHIAAMAKRRARIVQSLAEVDVKIRQARDGLSEAYHGVRRSEIAASARAEQNRRRAG